MNIVERVWRLLEAVAGGAAEEANRVARAALVTDEPTAKKAAEDNMARSEAAVALLAAALKDATVDLRSACGMDGPVPQPGQYAAIDLRPEGAVLKWDALVARWVAGREDFGKLAGPSAEGLMNRAANRVAGANGNLNALWAGWLRPASGAQGEASPVLETVARLLWTSHVRDELERVRAANRRHPGLVLAVADRIQPALVSGATLGDVEGETRPLVGGTGEPAGTVILSKTGSTPVVDAQALEVLMRGVRSLGLLSTHRAVRWIVTTVHDRAAQGDADARVIAVRGWSDLAERVGSTSKKDAGHLRDALLLLDRLRFDLPDGSVGGLLAVRHWRPLKRRGNPHRVEITVLTPLMPNYVQGLERGEKRIVPLTQLPPFVGRAQEHGNQAALQLAVLGEMSRRSQEIPRSGGVRITDAAWDGLAARAGVPSSTLHRVRDRWLHDGDDGAAFLRAVGRDRYALAPAHHPAWEFLIDGGTRRDGGESAGKRSAAAKRRRSK